MNKLITLPLFVMVLMTLAGIANGDTPFNDAWIYGLVAVGLAAVAVGSLLLKDTALAAIWKDVTVVTVWVALTGGVLWMFQDGGDIATIFYSGLTIIFFIGIFMDVDGGGD
jgi:hypothetical protein